MYTSKFWLVLFISCFISSGYTYYEDYVCNHSKLDFTPELLDVKEAINFDDNDRILENDYSSNIRIFAHYDLLDKASPSFKAYVQNELAPPVIDYFQAALKVKFPIIGNLTLPSDVTRVCNVDAPEILLNGSVIADYFIFFDAKNSGGTNLADSKTCSLALGSKRPIVATTIFNPRQVLETHGNILLHEKNIYILLHEMTHNFGFSGKLYNFFIDAKGNLLENHIKTKVVDGATAVLLDLPPLTSRLRKYFGCSSLEGAILENDGGNGTSGSHFERKFFVYEYMSTGAIDGRRISELGLALLEGTGWYIPNYDYAEPYFFGRDQGCTFFSEQCSVVSTPFDEYCVGSDRGCAFSGRGGGQCGFDAKANGCRYYVPDEGFDCENPDGFDNARFPELQVYGRDAGSKCFTGTLNRRNSTNGKNSFCFTYNCLEEEGMTVLDINIGKNKLRCNNVGQIAIDGYYGFFDCPDPITFCNTVGKKYCPRNCMGRGKCVNSKCECNNGFSGIDCALLA